MNEVIENCYISAACNCTPTCADWGKNNLICYGSCYAVLIYKLNHGGGKVVNTLIKHTSRVNSVRWIKGKDPETELVSGSSDGSAVVWSLKNEKYVPYLLKGHESNVNLVDGLYKDNVTIVITASMDSTIKIWVRTKDEDFALYQTIDLGYSISLAIKCVILPKTDSILFASAVDNSCIQLYLADCKSMEKLKFCYLDALKGHEDWVRGLDFTVEKNGDVLLASASQDCFVRLWRFSKQCDIQNNNTNMVYKNINLNNDVFTIYLIGILTGHEGWVYSVNWHPGGQKLLTASIDKTMIIWENDSKTNLWLENMRVGEVGGNTLGFYGGMFGTDGDSILAYSYHGAFHIWNYEDKNASWKPAVTVRGHFDEVVDMSWDHRGAFLMSVSSDQTTRIHAPWIKQESNIITWHEIARPQVHGYDMSSIALLSRYKFVSSAEEKVIRVFQAPVNFRDNFLRICNIADENEDFEQVCAKGASVPSLGLSNKAIYGNDNDEQARVKGKEMYPEETHFTAINLTEPPTEETLIQNTLWPEIQKLYGHGYEVYCLTANTNGSLIASACKSTSLEHAAVLIWDTSNWKIIQKLQSHTLTVVQLAFSPDSKHLLSVSRDRRWTLFSINSETNIFELSATTSKSNGIHSRIIWCCGWSNDSKYFATGSREGKVVIWNKNSEKQPKDLLRYYEAASEPLELKGESVTALCFAPDLIKEKYLMAVGLECGKIHLFKWYKNWTCIISLDESVAHHLTVRRLAFRPVFGKTGDALIGDKDVLQLASCSSDHSIRIYNVKYKSL